MVSSRTRDRAFYIAEVIFQQILAVFCLIILWELFKTHDFASKGTWHIICSVFGVGLCMAEGVQIFRKQSIVTVGDTRLDKGWAHLIIMGIGFLSITIGISLKVSQKLDANRSHFESTHAILGLSFWIIALVTALGGLIVKYADRFDFGRTSMMKFVHLALGVTAYIIGIVCLGYGLNNLGVGTRGRDFLIVLMSIYVAYSLIGPCLSLINFTRN